MTLQGLKHAIFILGLIMIAGIPEQARAAEPDWKAVESALGKSGQAQPGGVFRIGMPRTDLTVTVKGVRSRLDSRSDRTPPSSRWENRRW
jgi:Domain of Unknown Function (DUF1259).